MGDNNSYPNELCGQPGDYNDKRKLKQAYVNKTLQKQKLSQEYTTDMLGRAISKAEYLSSRFGKNNLVNKQFNYYNRFDNGINKDKNSLIKSFINALDTLQDYYQMDGPNKTFPSNLKQNDLIKYIENLRNNLIIDKNDANKRKIKGSQKNDSKEDNNEVIVNLFNDFIHIIKGDAKINFDGYFNCESATVDPKMLVESGIDAMKFTSKQEAEWIKKFEENGDYDVKMQIGKDWKTNPNISDNMIFGNSYI